MITIRNVGGAALFLFGTTYLWLTPAFATASIDTTGFWWGLTQILALLTLAGFTIATWGLFRRSSWWRGAALTAAALGLLTLIPYWIAAQAAGEVTPWFTALILALGCAAVFLLLLAPRPRTWIHRHVMAGR
jgi:hypothetical protein